MYYSNGNYIPKKITDCTDREICEEFLYHIGVPKNKFSEIFIQSIVAQGIKEKKCCCVKNSTKS